MGRFSQKLEQRNGGGGSEWSSGTGVRLEQRNGEGQTGAGERGGSDSSSGPRRVRLEQRDEVRWWNN